MKATETGTGGADHGDGPRLFTGDAASPMAVSGGDPMDCCWDDHHCWCAAAELTTAGLSE